MKWIRCSPLARKSCRSPCGERGLKYKLTDTIKNIDKSLPVRGAWVEMLQ